MGKNVQLWSPSLGDITLTAALLAQIAGALGTTSVTATVGTTLSAAALTSGIINRSGPTAAFTDTTDTAAAIQTLAPPGSSTYVDLRNLTAFPMTLTAGTGVTISSNPVIPPNSAGEFLVIANADGSVSFNHVFTGLLTSMNPETLTALTTVGAGVITDAGIAAQGTARGGVQIAAFTDATDTAAAIIAAQPNARIGASWEYTYNNNTIFPATIGGGTGVTVSGATVVPANSWVRYLVKYTAAATITMQAIGQGYFPKSGTFIANGSSAVVVADTAVTAGSNITITLKTIGGTPAGAPFLSAITPGTGFSAKAALGDTSTYAYEIRG